MPTHFPPGSGTVTLRVADPYAQCHEFDGWDIYAVDGHYHKAACYDPKLVASDGTLRAKATGHFFRMNMRTHHPGCLAMDAPKDGKKMAPDMAAIKRFPRESDLAAVRWCGTFPP
ncbi:MAG: hypothetical protein NTW21_20380 [Verrucomicrobia bacterium]|nr:hypothetical protein [Verrucomicrobiota bacterium]